MGTEPFYYMILFVYVSLWLCQLVACHLTHSLIVLTESYINLYRILDISLGIIHLRTQKALAARRNCEVTTENIKNSNKSTTTFIKANGQEVDDNDDGKHKPTAQVQQQQQQQHKTLAGKLFNATCTYQYKRLPLLGSFINGLFLSALLMSAAIEGIQTCFHSSHAQGSDAKTFLNDNATFPIILVGFAVVGLTMQYCSLKAHEMREEEVCSNSLLDLQKFSSGKVASDGDHGAPGGLYRNQWPGRESIELTRPGQDIATNDNDSKPKLSQAVFRELNASNLLHPLIQQQQVKKAKNLSKQRSYDVNLNINRPQLDGNTPVVQHTSSLQELPLIIRSNEIAHANDDGRVSLKSLRLSLDLESLIDLKNLRAVADNETIPDNSNKSNKYPSNRDNWFLVRYFASPLALMSYASIVYYKDEQKSLTTEISDAILAVSVVVLLFAASYPPMKRAGKILLQTSPDNVNLAKLKRDIELLSGPIMAVEDLHIWSLTSRSNRVATCSLILNKRLIESERQVRDIISEVKRKFLDQNIKCTTIQPMLSDEPDCKIKQSS